MTKKGKEMQGKNVKQYPSDANNTHTHTHVRAIIVAATSFCNKSRKNIHAKKRELWMRRAYLAICM